MLTIIKNNNPCALRFSNQKWVGETGGYKGFSTFKTPVHGIRAAMVLLQRSYLNAGFNTLEKIFKKYAPITDGNNPSRYANRVLALINSYTQGGSKLNSINTVIIATPANIANLVRAIIEVECGSGVYAKYYSLQTWVIASWWFEFGVEPTVLVNDYERLEMKAGVTVYKDLKLKPFFVNGTEEQKKIEEKKQLFVWVVILVVLALVTYYLRK